MVLKDQINRINELYHKQKKEGLTEEEKSEQQSLRRIYLDSMKENLKSQLENIKVVSPEEYNEIKNKEESHN